MSIIESIEAEMNKTIARSARHDCITGIYLDIQSYYKFMDELQSISPTFVYVYELHLKFKGVPVFRVMTDDTLIKVSS